MNCEEALALVESRLVSGRLTRLQKAVFRSAWEDQSYLEIARTCGYEVGYVKQTGSQLWQLLSKAFDERVTKNNLQGVLRRQIAESTHPLIHGSASAHRNAHPVPDPVERSTVSPSHHFDWGDAADVSHFYGRTRELTLLEQWLSQDSCRLIGLFGMGGIGKTSLSIRLARHVQHQFDCVIWRSLRNAPPLLDLLADLIQSLSNQRDPDLPDSLEGRLRRLMGYLRQHRCLLVLDNGETLMGQGTTAGGYLPGYEGYAQLWQWVGELDHRSTVVLTSREKPAGLAAQEGQGLPVRSLRLNGLPPNDGQALFAVRGEFAGSEAEWRSLIDHYAGNPLALKMVAPVIQDLFDGQVGSFLECLREGTSIFGDIQDLLEQQLNRLSEQERRVMNWLAIARKPVTLSQLRAHFAPPIPLGQLLEALEALERRCLIDKPTSRSPDRTQTRFTLQPVVMEYVTERLIERIEQEINGTDTLDALCTLSLLHAPAKDHIRQTQSRLILQPIVDRLLQHWGSSGLLNHLQRLLQQLRKSPAQAHYAGGNVINLISQMGADLTGWDFSYLPVWSADLRRVTLHQVNFTGADLSKSAFTETFSQVLAIAFNPDGTLLATGDVNHEIHLWQVSDGKQLLTLRINEGWVWSVAFSPDGRWLASSANRAVHLWDVQTGEQVRVFQGYSDRVFSVAFSPDGTLLATGSEDHLVRIWNVRTGELLHTLKGHTNEVRSVAFSPAVRHHAAAPILLASASYDGTVRLWDAVVGNCIGLLRGHNDWVWSVAFSPDGSTLASSSSDRTVKLWEVATGNCRHTLHGHTRPVRTLTFCPDGRTLASGSDDRTLRLWEYQTGQGLRVLNGHSSWIAAIASNSDGLLASGGEDQAVRLWDSRTGLCLRTLQGYSNGVWSVAFNSVPFGAIGGSASESDTALIASGSQDRAVRLWDLHTGNLQHTLYGHSGWIWSIAFNPIFPILASGSEDRTIRLWDSRTQQMLHVLEEHQDAVLSVLFSPDGQTLISGGLDGTIRLWDGRTGAYQQTLSGHTGGIWGLALCTGGHLLVSSSQDQTLKLWDLQQRTCLKTLHGHQSWIRCVAVNPACTTLISGSSDGIIKAWDIDSGTCTRTLQAHNGPVLSVAFHPDGQFFASSSTDTSVRLWDAQSGACLQVIQGHHRWVRFVTFSPDGHWLASCSQDETVRVWPIQGTQCGEAAVLRVPRPYEGMAIAHVTGLTPAQQNTLYLLGAVD